MKIRTQLKAGRINMRGENLNHNEALQVRSTLKAGGSSYQHNESMQTRTGLKAGRLGLRGSIHTTARKGDRLELLVVRAGLKAGRMRMRGFRR
jgi:hypothetical protein